MGILFANNAQSYLAADLAIGGLSLTVTTGTGSLFPTLVSGSGDYFYATLIKQTQEKEIVKVTARTGDVFTIERAKDNTTAKAFVTGEAVELRLTNQGIVDKADEGLIPLGYLYYKDGLI